MDVICHVEMSDWVSELNSEAEKNILRSQPYLRVSWMGVVRYVDISAAAF